jgi:hypothetical protein
MKTNVDAFLGLTDLVINDGMPEVLITYGSKEQANKPWIALIRKHEIKENKTESYFPWPNQAELEIRELQRKIRSFTLATKSPKRLWCYLESYVAACRRLQTRDGPGQDGRCAYEKVKGETPNVSKWMHNLHGMNGSIIKTQAATLSWQGGLEWQRTMVQAIATGC